MPDVFISYSRRDSDYVQRLARELEERGKQAWIDVDGMRDAEVFPAALRRAIESSDAFAFVISPDSVRSPFCEQEVAHAVKLNKRVVPLALRDVADEEIPEEIRVRNWISVGDGEFDRGLDRLVNALEADLEWEHEHTRLTVKALEWQESGKDRSFLVRGSELRAAEQWLAAGAARPKENQPTGLEQEYLLAARRSATRRLRTLVGVSAGVAVVAIALLVFALIARGQAASAQRVAKSRALAAESATELSADPDLSVLLAVQAVRTSATPEAMYALREAIDQSPLRRQLPARGEQGCVVHNGFNASAPAIAYSPSGRQIAEVACDGTLMILDDVTGHVKYQRNVGNAASAIAFSPDGRTIAVGAQSGITLLSAATAKRLKMLSPISHETSCPLDPLSGACTRSPYCGQDYATIPSQVAFSPDGSWLAASYDFNLDIWKLRSGSTPRVVGGPAGCIQGIGFSPSGAEILLGANTNVDVIDTASGRLLGTRTVLPGRPNPPWRSIDGLAVSPNGRQVSVSLALDQHNSGAVDLFDTAPWKRVATVDYSPNVPIGAMAFSPDSSRLAIGAGDGSAGIWSTASGQEVLPLRGHTARISSIAWRPDGREITTTSEDGEGLVWRTSLSQGATIATGAGLALTAAATGRGRIWGAFASPGVQLLRSWTMSGTPVSRYSVPGPPFNTSFGPIPVLGALTPHLSEDGRFGILFDDRRNLLVRDLTNNRTVGRISTSTLVSSVSLIGDRMVTGDQTGAVNLYDVATGLTLLGGGTVAGCGAGTFVTVSADGQRAAGVDSCGSGLLLNARTGRQLETFNTGVQTVSGVSLSPDGRLLAISSLARTTTLFDLATKHSVHVLTGDPGSVTSVAFNPQGKWLATGSEDGDVRIWNPDTGQLMRVLEEGASVTSVAFTPNGQDVVSTDGAGRIHIQDACSLCGNATGLLRLAATRVTRSLTAAERAAYGA